MGEYATRRSDREHIKIGTCEDMYYLRADQIEQVYAADRSETDPRAFARELRFRFPFPNEDDVQPGEFDKPFHSLPVYVDEADIPAFEHSTVQFTAHVGYLLSITCPEGAEGRAFAKTLPHGIHKNGWVGGTARIVQQRAYLGRLVLVAACPGCEAKYRLETLDMAEPFILACRQEADRAQQRANVSPYGKDSEASTVTFWHEVADRILKGYTDPPEWVARLAKVPA